VLERLKLGLLGERFVKLVQRVAARDQPLARGGRAITEGAADAAAVGLPARPSGAAGEIKFSETPPFPYPDGVLDRMINRGHSS